MRKVVNFTNAIIPLMAHEGRAGGIWSRALLVAKTPKKDFLEIIFTFLAVT